MNNLNQTYHLKNQNGVTLVELLVTSVISVIIIGAVIVFTKVYGWTTEDMTALQILQQESSVIAELFIRTVRKGDYVCEFGAADCPNSDGLQDTTSHIAISNIDGSTTEFKISGNNLSYGTVGNFKNVSTRLLNVAGNKSSFVIMPLSRGATLIFTLILVQDNDTITYTETVGSVLCKN